MLATSNGHSGIDRETLGRTSPDVKDTVLLGDARGTVRPGMSVLVGLTAGGIAVRWVLSLVG